MKSTRTLGLRLTPGYVAVASLVAAAGGLAASALDTNVYGSVIVALILALVVLLTWRGSSVPDWLARRRRVAEPLRPVEVTTRDRAAVTWSADTGAATVWVEIEPSDPFAMTLVDADDNVSRDPVDMRVIESLMTQSDITLSRVSVVTLGQSVAVPTPAATMINQLIGQTPTHTGGRTFIVVALRMEDSLAAVHARATDGSVVVGTHKAVLAAAARIRIQIESAGMRAHVLSPEQAEEVSRDVLAQTSKSAKSPTWDRLGGGGEGSEIVSLSPRSALGWNPDSQRAWNSVPARRVYESLSLDRLSSGTIASRYQVTFVSEGRGLPGLSPRSMGLQRIGGQQLQALSRYVPLAVDREVDTAPRPLTGRDGVPLRAWPGGLGVYVGTTDTRDRVFMRVSGGGGEALHLVGQELLAQQFLLRLAPQQVTIDVRIGDGGGERMVRWEQFVAGLRSPLITFRSNPHADVVVVDAGYEREFEGTTQTVLVISPSQPLIPPHASIVAHSGDRLAVTSGGKQVDVAWSLTPQERDFLVVD